MNRRVGFILGLLAVALIGQVRPMGSISGKVIDEDGKPLANIGVEALSYLNSSAGRTLGPGLGATTNAAGEYRIEKLSAAHYRVRASADQVNRAIADKAFNSKQKDLNGYGTTFYYKAVDADSAQSVEVTGGANVGDIDLQMKKIPLFTIYGQVQNPHGHDNHAKVNVQRCGSDGYPMEADLESTTPFAGGFYFGDVIPGTYCVTYEETEPQDPKRLRLFAREFLTIAPSRSTEEVRLFPTQPGDIQVISMVDGKLVKAPSVRLNATRRTSVPQGKVDSDGNTLFERVKPERYQVSTYPPTGTYLRSIRFNGRDVSDGFLELRGEGGTLELDFATGGGRVKGKLDKPVRGLRVTLAAEDTLRSRAEFEKSGAITDKNGEFEIGNLPPGRYHVLVWSELPDSQLWAVPDFQARFFDKSPAIKLEAGQMASVDVKVIPAEEIRVVARSF